MTKFRLSKNVLDIGYFSENLEKTLRFWKEELNLDCEEPVHYNEGLTQYRHPFRDTIIKVNCSDKQLINPPTGYAELYLATNNRSTPKTIENPDGELITLVPKGFSGITETAIKVRVTDKNSHADFYEKIMGFTRINDNTFQIGRSLLFIEEQENRKKAGHWVSRGFRYLTLHVHNIEETFRQMVTAGAEVGEKPYAIGAIAKIAFVKDPDGNWIEVAQRASLAGTWT